MLKANEFYDQASAFYDDMTRFKKRQAREREWFRLWREKYPFDSALDAGCGSGSHTFALLAEGVRAAGVDISARMIDRARTHAQNLGLTDARFIQTGFGQLSETLDETFDAVFCLGNSLAHLAPGGELQAALNSFAEVLNPNGLLVIQLLNYEKILQKKERIIDIHREGDQAFIRFYDFNDTVLYFNILHIDWSSEPPRHDLQATIHYPYRETYLRTPLIKCGLSIEARYGNIKLADYDPGTSPNLVLAARKK